MLPLRLVWVLTAAALCVLVLVLQSHVLREDPPPGGSRRGQDWKRQVFDEGQLVAGTCEIVTLDRDSSQPQRTIARQTARCACRKGQIAGTTRARPACVDVRIIRSQMWCEMTPCLDEEGCNLLVNQSGWTCTQPGGRVKTTTLFWPDEGVTRREGVEWTIVDSSTPDGGVCQEGSSAEVETNVAHKGVAPAQVS